MDAPHITEQDEASLIAALRERCEYLAREVAALRARCSDGAARCPQFFMSHQQAAFLLGGVTERTVLDRVKAGAFGDEWFQEGRVFFISATGFNLYVERQRTATVARLASGRTIGEARRAVHGQFKAAA